MRCFTTSLAAALLVGAAVRASGAQQVNAILVCAGTDRVLRYQSAPPCPKGEMAYRLDLVSASGSPADNGSSATKVAELTTAVDKLQARVTSLEAAGQGDKSTNGGRVVFAPFEVIDKSGNPILTVADAPRSSMPKAGRFFIGKGSAGNYGLWVSSPSGAPVAAIGQTKGSAGGITAWDAAGNVRVQMDGSAGLSVFNPSGAEVATLALNPNGNTGGLLGLRGIFQIYDKGGRTTVEAGTVAEGVGVVRTGPRLKCVSYAGIRIPDCIVGFSQ